jgi:arylsulfatase A-like enzyme
MIRRLPLAWTLVALLLAGCDGGDSDRSSALLLTVDSLRPEALSCFGNPEPITPNLDRFAEEGVLYTNARTVAPLTVPAFASIMTGLYPIRHSARDNHGVPLPDEALTLAERASDAGFHTAAIVGAAVLDRGVGVAQGFEYYRQPPLPSHVSVTARYPEWSADEVVAEVERWLAGRDRSRPFLLWVHLFDPHAPYAAPLETTEEAGGHPYMGEVAVADEAIGRIRKLLESEGLLEDTFVAIASDHGEGLGDHGESSHGAFCYDSTLRVPLILRFPDGSRAGERSEEIVSVVDLFPTLLDALGIDEPGDVDGLSLFDGAVPVDRGVYFESYFGYLRYGWSPIAGWVDVGGKYLHGATPEFYNPTSDPTETTDLIGARPDVERYREAIAAVAARPRLKGVPRIDEALRATLEAMGYAAGIGPDEALPEPLAVTALPDAGARREEMQKVTAALGLGERKKYDEAIRALQEVTENNPRNRLAQSWLATYLVHSDRCEEAIPVLQGLLRGGSESGSAYNSLGHCLMEGGDAQRALVHFRRASQLDPTNPIPVGNLAAALDRLGRTDEAGIYWRRFAELTPTE